MAASSADGLPLAFGSAAWAGRRRGGGAFAVRATREAGTGTGAGACGLPQRPPGGWAEGLGGRRRRRAAGGEAGERRDDGGARARRRDRLSGRAFRAPNGPDGLDGP